MRILPKKVGIIGPYVPSHLKRLLPALLIGLDLHLHQEKMLCSPANDHPVAFRHVFVFLAECPKNTFLGGAQDIGLCAPR